MTRYRTHPARKNGLMARGIEERHSRKCRSVQGGRCNCEPTYRASVWSPREQRLVRRTFPSVAAAKGWHIDASAALRQGKLRAVRSPQVSEAISEWLQGAREGTIRTRGRQEFKPSTIRAVEQTYRLRLKDELGSRRLDGITTTDIQDLIDLLHARGVNPSTIEGTMLPLRLVYRRAVSRGVVAVDPTDALELPERTSRGKRKPPAPKDAAALLAAVPVEDAAIWATAMLAGLRRGELMGLRWEDVDFKAASSESSAATTRRAASSGARRAGKAFGSSPSSARWRRAFVIA